MIRAWRGDLPLGEPVRVARQRRLVLRTMKLPRSRRITSRADFQRVRSSGSSLQGRFLVVGYLADPSMEEPFRLGLITTKRLGGAVVRNRVRRRLRGVVHRTGDRIAIPHWIVLVARTAAAAASSAQLEKEWKWMMHRIPLVASPSPPEP